MKTRTLLFLIVQLLVLTEIANCYPISPSNLRDLVLNSELVIVAKVVKTERVKQKGNRWANSRATLQVSSVLKGPAGTLTVYVYYNPNMICPQPARYDKGKSVIAFLNPRQEGDGYVTNALSYGTKILPASDMKVYEARVKELIVIEKGTDKDQRSKKTVEWLMKCTEHPATRWEGLHGLRGARFRIVKKDEKEKDNPSLHKLLSGDQKQRLFSLLKMWQQSADESSSYPGMVMFILADLEQNQKLNEILHSYNKVDWNDRKKVEKRSTILVAFIQEYGKNSNKVDAGDGK